MPTGVVRIGTQVPKDTREWERVLRTLNTAVQVDAEGNVLFEGVAPDSIAFVTIGNTTLLPNERALSVSSELTLTDNGAGSSVQIGVAATIARDTEVAAAVTAHEASPDPHPGYTTAAELAAAITAHEGAGDPHPTYTTAAELAAGIAAHEAAGNPHPTYLTQAEGDALYVPLADVLDGSATYDPPDLATGATAVTSVTVTGAAAGDFAIASHSDVSTTDADKVVLHAKVTATNTVTVVFQNHHSGNVDLASGTLRARVWKQ